GRGRWRTFAEQLHVEAAFFLRLAQRGLLRILVQLDVSAERQPFVQLAMVDEQYLVVVNDKDGDGEINFFVDVGHTGMRQDLGSSRTSNSFGQNLPVMNRRSPAASQAIPLSTSVD